MSSNDIANTGNVFFHPIDDAASRADRASDSGRASTALQTDARRVEIHLQKHFEGRVTLYNDATGNTKMARINLTSDDAVAASKAKSKFDHLFEYESDPESFERAAHAILRAELPWLGDASAFVLKRAAPVVVVSGFAAHAAPIVTPDDGVVDGKAVRAPVATLVGTFGRFCEMGGFSYASENKGLVQRAVAPIKRLANEVSSQGYKSELNFHCDNANQPMACEHDALANGKLMNPYQGFVAINTEPTVPMELAAVADIKNGMARRFGPDSVAALYRHEFAIKAPASHNDGGEIAASQVPLFVHDDNGLTHARYHADNVIGLTDTAEYALTCLHETVAASPVIALRSKPGDLILYSNTRMMHRRSAYKPRFDGTDRYFVRVYFAQLSLLAAGRVLGAPSN